MIWIQLTSGRGPAECEFAVSRIAELVQKAASDQSLDVYLADASQTVKGLRSALIAIEGDGEDLFAESWNGTIQWTCPSPFRSNTKRRNWFIGASLIKPPLKEKPIDERDLKFESFRASGPGGQHVNVTDSAVRVTHIPTGLVTHAQEERSHYRNKSLAVSRLAGLLEAKDRQAIKDTDKAKWEAHDDLIRGNPIRVFRGPEFK